MSYPWGYSGASMKFDLDRAWTLFWVQMASILLSILVIVELASGWPGLARYFSLALVVIVFIKDHGGVWGLVLYLVVISPLIVALFAKWDTDDYTEGRFQLVGSLGMLIFAAIGAAVASSEGLIWWLIPLFFFVTALVEYLPIVPECLKVERNKTRIVGGTEDDETIKDTIAVLLLPSHLIVCTIVSLSAAILSVGVAFMVANVVSGVVSSSQK